MGTSEVLHMLAKDATRETLYTTVGFALQAEYRWAEGGGSSSQHPPLLDDNSDHRLWLWCPLSCQAGPMV